MLFTGIHFWWLYAATAIALQVNSRTRFSLRFQSGVILVASYVFYASWDWRFLGLIVFCSAQTYFLGVALHSARRRRQTLLWSSIALNLLMLGFFKYFGFFYQELQRFLQELGISTNTQTLEIILPVGISFYVFQSLTFVIDAYNGKIKQLPRAIDYFAYIAFFPQLVAGPIERARNLLPQFERFAQFSTERLWKGINLIVFGLFLKVCIADNLAGPVDSIFSDYATQSGGTLILGALYFSVQIYGDFCGYSTIAIGIAKVIGFDLMTNFDTPYFATSLRDFSRRWHISLSSFFRDYIYIPLGGNRANSVSHARNTIITFTLSGIWHGANWTFIVWGMAHGILASAESTIRRQFGQTLRRKPAFAAINWLLTMTVVGHLWIFFRSDSIADSINYLSGIYTRPGLPTEMRSGLMWVGAMIIVDVIWRNNTRLDRPIFKSAILTSVVLTLMFNLVLAELLFDTSLNPFIYFQF